MLVKILLPNSTVYVVENIELDRWEAIAVSEEDGSITELDQCSIGEYQNPEDSLSEHFGRTWPRVVLTSNNGLAQAMFLIIKDQDQDNGFGRIMSFLPLQDDRA